VAATVMVAAEMAAEMAVMGASNQRPGDRCEWISGSGPTTALLNLVFMLLLCIGTVGCGPDSGYSGRVAAGELDRNLTLFADLDGRSVVKIECTYLGKRPGDPERYSQSHDYQAIDTDFYRLEFFNLTADTVVVEHVDYRLEYGVMDGPDFATADSIVATWGTNRIPPLASIARNNNFVYSRRLRNTLFKRYRFRFQSDIEGDHRFFVEVPLVYLR